MADLTNLTEFIKESPDLPDGEYWTSSQWEIELTRSIPNWRKVVRDPDNWERIEKIRSKRDYDDLCAVLVKAVGLGLLKRWFHSDVSDQQNAAREWLIKYASIDASLWGALDRSMKDRLLEDRFRRWPGEPFKTLERYGHEIHHYMMRRIDRADLSDTILRVGLSNVIPSLPYITGYVPSPEIENLRFVIKDAGDQEYLSRIDEMISRREEACKVASFQQQHRIPYTPNSNERELIARVMEITRKSGYLPAALPPIFISYETPPIFIAYPELEENDNDNQMPRDYERRREENQIPRNRERQRPETISIEELLGVYQSRHQQIIIFERGIKWRGHRYDEEWLRAVVLIHEIGHWITHVLPKPGVPTWSTDLFALSETDLKEGWAQLITWWIADQVDGSFGETFEELNQGQSPPYHVFEQFKGEPIDKVMASLERLRLLPWPGRLQDWKNSLGMKDNKAIADYDTAIELDPEDAAAYNNRGSAYLKKGEYDKAIADYDKAIELDPEDAAAYNNKGYAYLKKGEYDKAIADSNTAIKLDLEDAAEPSFQISFLTPTTTKPSPALSRSIKALIKAAKHAPNEAAVYLNLGSAYHKLGKENEAIENYDNVVRLCPDYETNFIDSKFLNGGQDAVEVAITLLNGIVNTPPKNADDFYYTGVQALFRNDGLSAETAFQIALGLGCDGPDKIHQHLENLKNRK